MAGLRKLQGRFKFVIFSSSTSFINTVFILPFVAEIDRTLKRIEEGIVEFDAIYEKTISAETQILKAKLEGDLKKEIKKLQRYREQVKGWASSAEIKNKTPLIDARHIIEKRMETFKIVERETKTKAYSREGLARDAILTPEEKRRLVTRQWLQDLVHKISDSVDEIEAEVELLEATGKKKDRETADNLEKVIKLHRWHIDKMEALLRLLDNAAVDPDQVDGLKDELDYYFEQCREEGYEADMEIYDDFDLAAEDDDAEDEDEDEGVGSSKNTTNTKVSTPVLASTPTKATVPSIVPLSIPASATITSPSKDRNLVDPLKPKTASVAASSSSSTTPVAASTPAPAAASAPAAVTAAKTGQIMNANAQAPGNTVSSPVPASKAVPGVQPGTSIASAKPNTKPAPAISAATPIAAATSVIPAKGNVAPVSSVSIPATQVSNATIAAPSVQPNVTSVKPQESLASIVKGKSQPVGGSVIASSVSAGITSGPKSVLSTSSIGVIQPASQDSDSSMSSLADAIAVSIAPHPIPAVLEKGPPLVPFLHLSHQRYHANVLNSSLGSLPELIDTERPKPYVPRNPSVGHPSFPSIPASGMDTASFFEKLDLDTLFFCFYYHSGGYPQYLAAKALKAQSWRFHKRFSTWFQRHEEPKASDSIGESGTYVYFDYENGWVQRLKRDFTFEYAYLEDESVDRKQWS
jgi:CCR4-NOT transcription complex subunit 3